MSIVIAGRNHEQKVRAVMRAAAARPYNFTTMWRTRAGLDVGPGSNPDTITDLIYVVPKTDVEQVSVIYSYVEEHPYSWIRCLTVCACKEDFSPVLVGDPQIFAPLLIQFGFRNPTPEQCKEIWSFEEWIPYPPSIVQRSA